PEDRALEDLEVAGIGNSAVLIGGDLVGDHLQRLSSHAIVADIDPDRSDRAMIADPQPRCEEQVAQADLALRPPDLPEVDEGSGIPPVVQEWEAQLERSLEEGGTADGAWIEAIGRDRRGRAGAAVDGIGRAPRSPRIDRRGEPAPIDLE